MTHLDGNALAGPLADLFRADMTTATVRCASCRRDSVLADGRVFLTAMGAVLRCRTCDAVQAVLTTTDDRWVLNLSGAAHLEIPRA